MKTVILIGDGMADLPVPELGGLTPLEYAYLPHMHLLARRGLTGLVRTCYPGLPVESAVANLGILGYDPRLVYPGGRASFEALARGISLKDGDLALRCNLISIDQQRRITDFTAATISDGDALRIISSLSTDGTPFEIYSGQSYRNLLIVRNCPARARDLVVSPPHQHLGQCVDDLLVRGNTPEAQSLAQELNSFLLGTIDQLRRINRSFRSRADMCWVWSPSERPGLTPFEAQTGLLGAVVCGIDTIRGIGIAAGMFCEQIPGVTGYADSNFQAKCAYAMRYLQDYDLVYIHINSPDEESHQHSVEGKVSTLERIDREVLGPLMAKLNADHRDDYRVAVMPDHFTLVSTGEHKAFPAPFAAFGAGLAADPVGSFSEREIEHTGTVRLDSIGLIGFLKGS